MKLLFDQNLAPWLVALLADIFPASEHVRNVGLAAADDLAVWEYAKANGFAVVSKDADFRKLSFLLRPQALRRVRRIVVGSPEGAAEASHAKDGPVVVVEIESRAIPEVEEPGERLGRGHRVEPYEIFVVPFHEECPPRCCRASCEPARKVVRAVVAPFALSM